MPHARRHRRELHHRQPHPWGRSSGRCGCEPEEIPARLPSRDSKLPPHVCVRLWNRCGYLLANRKPGNCDREPSWMRQPCAVSRTLLVVTSSTNYLVSPRRCFSAVKSRLTFFRRIRLVNGGRVRGRLCDLKHKCHQVTLYASKRTLTV